MFFSKKLSVHISYILPIHYFTFSFLLLLPLLLLLIIIIIITATNDPVCCS